MIPLRLFSKTRFREAMPEILSLPNLVKALPFILHFSLTIVVAVGTLLLFGGKITYNLKNRIPRFPDFDGENTIAIAYKPLQSDMTTALTTAASATRVAAACWTGKLLWRSAFMFMEKGEITMAGFSKVVSGGITTRISLRDVSSRKNAFLVYLIIFTCFFMDFFSSILTGSVTWQPAYILVNGYYPVSGIPEGLNWSNISRYRDQPMYVSDAIERGAALALVSWGNINTHSSNLRIPTNLTRRTIIQIPGPQTIEKLNASSTLNNSRLPYFKVEKFEYLTDPETTLTIQQKSLLNDSSVYNPYVLDRGYAAFLPDTYWGPGSSPNLPNATTDFSEYRILGIRLNPLVPDCSPSDYESFIPSNVNVYNTVTANSSSSSCFVFANVTYTAGAAICNSCSIASPTVVEGDINGEKFYPVPDPLTIEALAITPSVGTHILLTFFADPNTDAPASLEDFTTEFVSRAYQAAWSSLAVELGGVGPDSQTAVAWSVPASRPTVRQWRVYLWAGLHIGILFCGIAFALWHRHFRHPWFKDPAMIAFQLDTAGIYKQGQVANPKDPWHPDAEHPVGILQLGDYDHDERPGQPRAVTLIQEEVDSEEVK